MADPKIAVPVKLTSKYYFEFKAKESLITKFAIVTTTAIADTDTNIFNANVADLALIDVSGKTQITEKQTGFSTQIIAQRPVKLTLKAKTDKGSYRTAQFSFPPRTPVIWITKAMYDLFPEANLKNLVLPYRGVLTYRLGEGNRYAIAEMPDTVITASVNQFIAAEVARKNKQRESTTTPVPVKTVRKSRK